MPDVPLIVVESPYRAVVAPLVAYLDVLDRSWPSAEREPIDFVLIPEYVARSWWERMLYNQAAKHLRATLLGRPRTVVINHGRIQHDGPTGQILQEYRHHP